MAMNKQEFIDLCPVYALGALDGDDLAAFRAAMAAADAEMRAALADALQTAANLSLGAPAAVPSAAVKDRLMARVRTSSASSVSSAASAETVPSESPSPAAVRSKAPGRGSWLDRVLVAWLTPRPVLAMSFGLLVLAVGLVVYVQSLSGNLRTKDYALAVASDRIMELQDSLSQKEALLEVIRARGMQIVVLGGTEASPAGYGKVMWDPERKTAVLQVSLPPQPEGKDYQLWVIRDSKPVDAGVFQVSARDGLYKIDRLVETDKAHINAFAVTVEPKGGVPQPTGAMVLLGAVEI
jgi:anti-sigma-K factor RskA